MTNTYNPFNERPGISPLKFKNRKAVDDRIEMIGRLADRHKEYVASRDYRSLIELSYDYDRMKYMHKTAAMIRAEAAVLEKRK